MVVLGLEGFEAEGLICLRWEMNWMVFDVTAQANLQYVAIVFPLYLCKQLQSHLIITVARLQPLLIWRGAG